MDERSGKVELSDGVIVTWHRIIGTRVRVFTAWEPSSPMGKHGTVMHIGGRCYGRVGTEGLPGELDRLPAMTDARYRAVKEWHAARYERAYRLIREAYPALANHAGDMGEIEVMD